MKILVAVKRVVDFSVKIRVKPDGSDVEKEHVKMSMNPFDAIAVEEAVRLKEKGVANEVVVVSIGDAVCQDILREALAMGADRAILVQQQAPGSRGEYPRDDGPIQSLEPLNIAKLLQAIAKQELPELIILGKQAIDDDANQTGQMLAALLKWPQGTFVSKLEFIDKSIRVMREVDGGLETLELNLPAVITTDLRLNEPRYLTLPNIMKAKQKKIEVLNGADLVSGLKAHITTLKVSPPAMRSAGIKVNSIEELLTKLRDEEKVWS